MKLCCKQQPVPAIESGPIYAAPMEKEGAGTAGHPSGETPAVDGQLSLLSAKPSPSESVTVVDEPPEVEVVPDELLLFDPVDDVPPD